MVTSSAADARAINAHSSRSVDREKHDSSSLQRKTRSEESGENVTINFRSHGRSQCGTIQKGSPTAVRGAQATHSEVPFQSTPVSIPSKMETVLYKEDRENMGFGSHALRFEDSRDENPGPGTYQLKKEFGKIADSDSFGKRGTGGFASKSRRFRPLNAGGAPIPGPGAYTEVLKPRPKKDFSNQSPVFVSPKLIPQREKGAVPGPGAYTVPETTNTTITHSFTKSNKLNQGHTFSDEPGPATYFRDPVQMRTMGGSAAFTHPSRRKFLSVHPDLPVPRRHLTDTEGVFVRQCGGATDKIPGPGTYDCDVPENTTFNAKGSSFFQHHSTVRVRPIHVNPGPGMYDAPILCRTNVPTITSSFVSVVDRQPDITKDAPGPAFYHISVPTERTSFHLNVKKRWM